MNRVKITNLTKTFPATRSWLRTIKTPAFTAVNAISFSIAEGENVGLLGPNGAGKTTTIQMLLGTLTTTSGDINYFGKNFFSHRSDILQHVGFASTYVQLPRRLTVAQNLHIYGRLYGMNHAVRAEQIKKYLKEFDMWDLRDKQTGLLSAGQIARITLIKAFLARPKVVLLDEPTAALDPDIATQVRAFILQQQKQYGVSFLFTSHNMSEVTEVCDRVLVLRRGEIVANNTPEQLAASVANARVELMVGDGLKRTVAYAQKNKLPHNVHGRLIDIEVDEDKLAQLLQGLAHAGVHYTSIAIKKPKLEDYFLHMSKQEREKKT